MIYQGEPDRDALVYGDERLTFAQLRERVDAAVRDLDTLDSGVVILDGRFSGHHPLSVWGEPTPPILRE